MQSSDLSGMPTDGSDTSVSLEHLAAESEIIVAEIQRDHGGLSKTVLIGEKAVAQGQYKTGQAAGDKLTMYVGDCEDIRRSMTANPGSDFEGGSGFGSSHSSGCNIAYGDGSVRFVALTESLQP